MASLLAQMIKNPSAVRETLGQKDPLEKEMATHSPVSLPGELHGPRTWWATVHGITKSWAQLRD